MDHCEQQLTERAASGDRNALRELFYALDADLRARIGARLGRTYRRVFDLDDIVQATYFEAACSISTFTYRGPGSFRGWVLGIAHTTLVDAIRELQAAKRLDERRRIEPESAKSEEKLFAALGQAISTPSGRVSSNERRNMLHKALAGLPEPYGKLIRWYDLEGLPAKVVGARLGKSAAAVYVMRPRAHRCLLKLLDKSDFFSTAS